MSFGSRSIGTEESKLIYAHQALSIWHPQEKQKYFTVFSEKFLSNSLSFISPSRSLKNRKIKPKISGVENQEASPATLIRKTANEGQYPIAKRIFYKALKQNKATSNVFRSFIKAAGCLGKFDDAEKAFIIALNQTTNDLLFITFIKAAHKCDRFDAVEQAFIEALKRQQTSLPLFENFVFTSSSYKKLNATKNACIEALLANKISSRMIENFVVCASECANVAANISVQEIIRDFIITASTIGRFDAAEEVFASAYDKGLIDQELLNLFVSLAEK